MESAKSNINGHQNVIVMRHGDRMDRFEPLWASTAERPWDPPLIHDGKVRAFHTGQRISSHVAFPIHRVFVSPFLRCIQTAVEVVAGLSAVPFIDNSKLKVAIEFGLCEILNSLAIKSNVAPKDGKFDFRISDLEAMFPEGTVDHNVDMVYKELPQWGESAEGFRERYVNTLKVLAQKYPSENLLLITHLTIKFVDMYSLRSNILLAIRLTLHIKKKKRREMESAKSNINGHQNVIVMRHGDRMDRFEPLWASTAERPWDPPLIHDGKVRAFHTGQRISSHVAFPIHRVFVSPFLRCIQTAVEVVAGLSAVPSIDNSKLKVAIEFGLCEILNSLAIKSNVAPKDGKFDFSISDLEAMFPEGTMDHNVDMVYKELPQWGESAEGFRERYVNTLKVLAQKYPSENLLLITHREGVGTTLSTFYEDTTVYEVDYCTYVELRREVSSTKAIELWSSWNQI
ncbi:hypothetical protein F2Q68_00045149 [Brassica cretica]|uniref:Phosphoglycerate mutase family protein n=1 Tax=Brassica cretica TaxID=69181 RepID=A0A8S9LJ00_BRACR|nr:hypothetical protein F2Q68_00045149 [Brassica cretica]